MHDRVRHRRRGLGRQHSRVVEAAAPHWSQRARSGEVARRSGAEKGRGTPPERGPWAVAGAGLAETAAVSTPQWVLIYLKRGMPPFTMIILAIVIDFLKIEKVELRPFEKRTLNGP